MATPSFYVLASSIFVWLSTTTVRRAALANRTVLPVLKGIVHLNSCYKKFGYNRVCAGEDAFKWGSQLSKAMIWSLLLS